MFLTMIFLLIFSLVGVAYDSARISAAKGYIKVAGDSAACTVFGNYDQELLTEYGLFGYGGYDGISTGDLNREFLDILEENLRTFYRNRDTVGIDIYRLKNVHSSAENVRYLTDEEIFYSQIGLFLKKNAISKVADTVTGKIGQKTSESGLEEKLNLAAQYESGEYEDAGKEQQEERPEKKSEDSIQKDTAGGNPLEAFSHMVRDGVLGMVCREETLSDREIISRGDGARESRASDSSSEGAADYLKHFLGGENLPEESSHIVKGKNKMLLLAYDRAVCPSYPSREKEGIAYAMEYLAVGKREEKSNLAAVVNRLLAVRTLLNFTYAASDPVLQEKSLATATAIAGFTGLAPVITGVQYTILLILSFQEGCVDVAALLDGKSVPVMKNSSNFKMRYEEICLGSGSLFQKKATAYRKEGAGNGLYISYDEYLTALLLAVDEDTLRERTLDVIQQNLRDKYNQSFCIDDCICESSYRITYEIDYIFKSLPFLGGTRWGASLGEQSQEVEYGYKSG